MLTNSVWRFISNSLQLIGFHREASARCSGPFSIHCFWFFACWPFQWTYWPFQWTWWLQGRRVRVPMPLTVGVSLTSSVILAATVTKVSALESLSFLQVQERKALTHFPSAYFLYHLQLNTCQTQECFKIRLKRTCFCCNLIHWTIHECVWNWKWELNAQ